MLRRSFFFVFALVLPSLALASEPGPSRLLEKNEILRGNFVHEHPLRGFAKPARSEGRFVVAPGRGMIWAVDKPLPMSFVFTQAGMVQLIGDMPLLSQSAKQRPFLGEAPDLMTAALAGDWDTLKANFDLKRSGSSKAWRVKIVPSPASRLKPPFKAVSASGNSFVDRAEVLRPDGYSDTFVFSNQRADAGGLSTSETAAFSLRIAP